MDIKFTVEDVYTELGRTVMEKQALDRTCDQLQAIVARLKTELDELKKPPEDGGVSSPTM